MPAYERFVIFAFTKGAARGGVGDFLVTASLEAGEGLLPSLALLLSREGILAGAVDTVHLVEALSVTPLSPLVCIEVSVSGVPGKAIGAGDMAVVVPTD